MNTTINTADEEQVQMLLAMLRPLLLDMDPPISPAALQTDAGRIAKNARARAQFRRVEAMRWGLLPALACRIAGPPNLGTTSTRSYMEAALREVGMAQADIDKMLPAAGVEPSTCQSLFLINTYFNHPNNTTAIAGMNPTEISLRSSDSGVLEDFENIMIAHAQRAQTSLIALKLAQDTERQLKRLEGGVGK